MSLSRGRHLRAVVALAPALLLSSAFSAPADAAKPARSLSTPQLIAKAQSAGEISEAKARVHLANAVLNPERLPKRFIGRGEWEGTPVLSRLRRDLRRLPSGSRPRARLSSLLEEVPAANDTCEGSTAPAKLRVKTEHFVIDFVTGKPGGGLTVQDYVDALEQSWKREIIDFGWTAPPSLPGAPDDRFLVRVDNQTYGMLGYVGAMGSRAGEIGDHPATPWKESHAWATCMVLRDTFAGSREASLRSLRSTAPHELAHAVQWGYGFADWLYDGLYDQYSVFSEATATWIEDEVFDDVNRAWQWGMPDLADSLDSHRSMWSGGSYGEEYKMWLAFRAMTERDGSGVAGGAEELFQNLFELIGGRKGVKLSPVVALNTAMQGGLPRAYNDAGVALWFMENCREGWKAPHCLEEASSSAASRTPRQAHGKIDTVGVTHRATIESRFAMQWVTLPRSSRPLRVHLRNGSADDELRLSVGCRMAQTGGTRLSHTALAAPVRAGQQGVVTVPPTERCLDLPVAVVTSASDTATSDHTPYELEVRLAGSSKDLAALPLAVR